MRKLNIHKICVAALFVVILAGAGFRHYRMATRCRTGVPARYEYRSVLPQPKVSRIAVGELKEQPVLGLERIEVGSAVVDANPDGLQMKQFHLVGPEVRVDHCSLSRVALTFQDNGDWDLQFRAHQNRRNDQGQIITARQENGVVLETSDLRGNALTVTVRCYAASLDEVTSDNRLPGKHLLTEYRYDHLWVRSGVARDVVRHGSASSDRFGSDLKRFFEQIDYAEVEVFYEK